MPHPRPPHLHRQITRHGKTVWYVRIGKGRRIRIKASYGTPEFDAEYHAAMTDVVRPRNPVKGPAASTLAWLIERYRETVAWRDKYSETTRRQRDRIFRQVIASSGDRPFAKVRTETIIAGRDRRAATPHQARHFLDAMRGLFRWALSVRHVSVDPTAGVTSVSRRKGGGFRAWTEEDVAAYWKRWPLGTHERVWLDVLLYTGLRRGDVVRIGRQHVRNGIARIKTEKSGFTVEVTLPILPVLARTLAAGPCGDLNFIVGKRGEPLTKASFGNEFHDACRAAGVPGSAHGVRKIAAATAANNGATTEQMKALFGWVTDSVAQIYVKTANREKLARDAARFLLSEDRNEAGNSIPSPASAGVPHL
jgi:integrase